MDFVTLNGSRLISNGQEIATKPLKRQTAIALITEVTQKYSEPVTMVFERHTAYLNHNIPKAERDFLAYFAGQSALINDWHDLPQDEILQITFGMDSSKASEIEYYFNQQSTQTISAFASANAAIDINAAGTSKGTGLKRLLNKFGLSGNDLIAFGDGGNDIPMLDFAKYSYAMANGMEEVKNTLTILRQPIRIMCVQSTQKIFSCKLSQKKKVMENFHDFIF